MLEDNQVLIQGMMANRYMDTFRDSILSWNKKLMAVADVVAIAGEIQVGVRDACAGTTRLRERSMLRLADSRSAVQSLHGGTMRLLPCSHAAHACASAAHLGVPGEPVHLQ